MGHIGATRELAASPEALWATVSDLANWDKWFTVHEKWLEEPPADGGSTFTVTGDFQGALSKGALGKAVEKDGAKQLDKTVSNSTRWLRRGRERSHNGRAGIRRQRPGPLDR